MVLSKLTNYTPIITLTNLRLPQRIEKSLADPQFDHSDSIDSDILSSIIIADISFKFNNKFFSQESLFGWVFPGPTHNRPFLNVTVYTVSLDNTFKLFWEQEEVEVKRQLTEEESLCELYSVNTTMGDKNGRYIVNLPSFVSDTSSINLNNNHINAYKRLIQFVWSKFILNILSIVKMYQNCIHFKYFTINCS